MSATELPRLVRAHPLEKGHLVIEADEAEREALARRFGLARIDSFVARIDLERKGSAIIARGPFEAHFVQYCAISGEEFDNAVHEEVLLRFVRKPSDRAETPEGLDESGLPIEIELSSEELDEIEYDGACFDLGEALAQSLGLALDPYAKGPQADAARARAGILPDDAPRGALADALKGLLKD